MENSDAGTRVILEVWGSKIPLRLSLASSEVSCPDVPLPLHILLPRFGYLHLTARQAFDFFERSLIRQQRYTPYFAYRGMPLPWHIPAGVLYELLADGEQPWDVTVHFPTSLPSSLLPWQDEEDFMLTPLRDFFFSSLKEAAFICQGPNGSNSVNLMDISQRDNLWLSVKSIDWVGYKNSTDSVNLEPVEMKSVPPMIPVRIFLRTGATRMEWRDLVKSTSRPVAGIHRNGSGCYPSLLDTLKEVLPAIPWYLVGDNRPQDGGASWGTAGKDGNAQDSENSPERTIRDGSAPAEKPGMCAGEVPQGGGENREVEDSCGKAVEVTRRAVGRVDVSVCGIRPPLEAPIAWLHAKMHAPDYFLYVVVIRD